MTEKYVLDVNINYETGEEHCTVLKTDGTTNVANWIELVSAMYTHHSILEPLVDELNKIQNSGNNTEKYAIRLWKENEQLKKELHLVHMASMFSTVQSFKGDVSKRYKYSKETDTVYDTANHYGQYNKILDKKEIVMLLNEYETVLNELKGDVE